MNTINLKVPEHKIWDVLTKSQIPVTTTDELNYIQKLAAADLLKFEDYSQRNLTISEATWAILSSKLLVNGCKPKQLSALCSILFLKYSQELLASSEEVSLCKEEDWNNCPIFLDAIIKEITRTQQDILINIYSDGSLGFTCSNNSMLTILPKPKDTSTTSISIYQIVAGIVGPNNLPPLKSTAAVISPEETELVSAFREQKWDSLTLTALNNQKEWKLECTMYGSGTEAENNSFKRQFKGTPHSFTTTTTTNPRIENYSIKVSKRIS